MKSIIFLMLFIFTQNSYAKLPGILLMSCDSPAQRKRVTFNCPKKKNICNDKKILVKGMGENGYINIYQNSCHACSDPKIVKYKILSHHYSSMKETDFNISP
jgi:hypothetical protein